MLAAKLFDAECHQVRHWAVTDWEMEYIDISFQSVIPDIINIQTENVETGPVSPSAPWKKKDESLALNLVPSVKN